MKFATIVFCSAAALALSACDIRPREVAEASPASPLLAPAAVAAAAAPIASPAPALPVASMNPVAQAGDRAVWSAGTLADAPAQRDMLIRAQVLLDRAHFSPGVIDGRGGENVKNAIAAYERANDLPQDGVLDAEVWAKLTADTGPILTDYVITEADATGPFTAEIPKKYEDMAKLDRLGFANPLEALAERFHMDQALLLALNPGVDLTAAGAKILVAATNANALPAKVAAIEVDKALKQVRAYDAAGKLLAAYPATVGSTDMPTPTGELAVRTIAPAPTWTYDPTKLNFGDKSAGKLTIKAGPNNPVGAVWIDLTKETYGIHGAPDPKLVGKVASHGCVRLTNWDAVQLSKAVEKGTKVVFLGEVAGKS